MIINQQELAEVRNTLKTILSSKDFSSSKNKVKFIFHVNVSSYCPVSANDCFKVALSRATIIRQQIAGTACSLINYIFQKSITTASVIW